MEIIYDAGASEALIIASTAEFLIMAEQIAKLTLEDIGKVSFSAKADCAFSALVVRIGSGPVLVSCEENLLSVSGGPEEIRIFSCNLPTEPELSAGYHVHFEHAGRERFVATDSVPLVIMVG